MSKFLAIRLAAMGDVAISVPALYSFADNYPQHQLYVLTKPQFAPLFAAAPSNVQVVGIDLKKYGSFGGLLRFYRQHLRPLKIDYVADLHHVMRSWVLDACLWLQGAKIAFRDKGKRERLALLQHRIHRPLEAYYQRFADVFEALGFPIRWTFKALTPDCPLEAGDEPWIGIAPFSAHEGKVYPLEKTEAVLAQLTALPKVQVFLFGGGAREAEILSQWAAKYPQTTSLVGRYTLLEELGVMSRLSVMLSMDSANMHLASLTGTPVVSVWGPSHPHVGFRPWNQSEDRYVQCDLPCRPCSEWGAKPCKRGDWACMNGIAPETIVKKLCLYL
ncbi:MAG: glycosyltransferase family 9 protein [Paludibacteraceae bacterium]|nr:glycosyltransferase family 9 protein [Paludibacteraceae bacterium]